MTLNIQYLNCNLFLYIYFCCLGLFFFITALLILLTESSVHSILYLMFLFIYLAQLTLLLKMYFLALIFIIVYIGAVCVLMLFHINLIKTFINRFDNIHNKELNLPFIVITIVLPLIQTLTLFLEKKVNPLEDVLLNDSKEDFIIKTNNLTSVLNNYTNYTNWCDLNDLNQSTEILGYLLYNIYFIYVIFGAILLFVAMIGSIFVTLKKRKDKKFQNIYSQIKVNLSKIVKLF